MAGMNMHQLTQQSGLPSSTLRYYEEVGLLHPVGRVGGQRSYDESALQRLALIKTGQKAGFTLAELAVLLNHINGTEPTHADWQQLISDKLTELDLLAQNIERMKRLLLDIQDCEDETLAECIVESGQRYG